MSTEYTNSNTHLEWECAEGHRWFAMPKHIKDGHWCRKCSFRNIGNKNRKYTIEQIHQIAKSNEGQCLSDSFSSVKAPLKWRCKEGHEWEAPLDRIIHQGSWCPECGGTKKLTLKEIQKIAAQNGGKCLSSKYTNTRSPLCFECSEGHRWSTPPANILQGTWCPRCGGTQKLTLKMLQKTATDRGGKCLSEEYVNSKTPMVWQCSEGHQWEADAGHIRNGNWCPECGGSRKRTLEEAHLIAKMRGGKCLSPKYVNAHQPLLWECADGHRWRTSYNNVKNGGWCHECASGLGERICRAYFEQIFGYPFPKCRPDWLRNTSGLPLELDGYCEGLSLAFEHQGEQHYSTNHYIASDDATLSDIQGRDKLKRLLCAQRGVMLIDVPEVPRLTPTEKLKRFIASECSRYGIKIPDNLNEIEIDLTQAFQHSELDVLREIAFERGGRCLSDHYLGHLHKIEWECAEGHSWEATPSGIKAGRWCPECGRKQSGLLRRNTIEDMRGLAKKSGGKCLSTRYLGSKKHLEWQCAEGHVWKAMPLNIQKGHWCPVCAVKKRAAKRKDTIENMQKIASEKGGKCISTEYVNARTHLLWECGEGHRWKAIPSSVKRGHWCKICSAKKVLKKGRLSPK